VSLLGFGLVVSFLQPILFTFFTVTILQLTHCPGKEGIGPNFNFPDGLTFLRQFVIPNFWFHNTTAYSICRMQGVPLGKVDFVAAGGGFDM
jgi:hypothetical protein